MELKRTITSWKLLCLTKVKEKLMKLLSLKEPESINSATMLHKTPSLNGKSFQSLHQRISQHPARLRSYSQVTLRGRFIQTHTSLAKKNIILELRSQGSHTQPHFSLKDYTKFLKRKTHARLNPLNQRRANLFFQQLLRCNL